ncbi:HupE/UreJ family protein [Cohnella endophytica]|uniref:HupE/UreJ family protein n=1 Tax=Cohnella endophytica TaxID=2419778 RepID=A0A494XDQ3_9BACL|nr:HupE/UreJ family protein [Cohnella endophytica]RKP46289.1 HupE/UreJ family protein [Cohnella endophytica]
MIKRLLVLSFVFCGLTLGLWPSTSSAHGEASLAYSTISYEDSVIKYVLQIDLYDLQRVADIEDADIDEQAPEAERFNKKSFVSVEQNLLSNIHLFADGLPLKGKLTRLSQVKVEGETQPFAEAILEYPVYNKPQDFYLGYDLVFDYDGWHINYVNVAIGELMKEAVFVADLHELQVGQMTLHYTLMHFFLLGLIHSFTGFESILVIVSFIIGCRSVKQFVAVLSVFLGFHALTFILASSQQLTLPNNFVNSIVASSIIMTSLYTLFSKQKKFYLWLAGGSGLFAGFGFAKNLAGMKMDSGHPLYSVVSFNAGIDTALIGIAAVLYLVHYLVKANISVPWILKLLTVFGIVWFIIKALF